LFKLKVIVYTQLIGIFRLFVEGDEVAIAVHPKPEFVERFYKSCDRSGLRFLVEGNQNIKLLSHKGNQVFKSVGEDLIDKWIIVKKLVAFFIDQPGNMALRVFPLNPVKYGRCSQDITLCPAFDDQNFLRERLVMEALIAKNLEFTGFISLEIKTVGFDQ